MMVEDVAKEKVTDAILFEDVLCVNVGYGIEESGCAFPVTGETTWEMWLEK